MVGTREASEIEYYVRAVVRNSRSSQDETAIQAEIKYHNLGSEEL